MLRKYSCDCIGFETIGPNGERVAWCVAPCDATGERDEPPVTVYKRPGLLEKTSEPWDAAGVERLLLLLGRMAEQGHQLTLARSILAPPG